MKISAGLVLFAGVVGFLSCPGVCRAQSFPLRQGQWEMSTGSGQGAMTQTFCITDATFKKSLESKMCTAQDLKMDSSGGSYILDCNGSRMAMKGTITMVFDGKEHMTSTGTMTSTMNGKPMQSTVSSDWRWKAPACTGNELNMRDFSKH